MNAVPRRLGAAFGTMTLVAGIVGALRQRWEATHRTQPVAAPPVGPIARRMAQWEPGPARHRWGRVLGSLWCAPLSACGLLLGWLSSGHVSWDRDHELVLFSSVGPPSSTVLRLVGAQANTVGQVVLCRDDRPSNSLLAHEALHVRQGERLGPLIVPLYLWLGALHGYRRHPLEQAPRRVAARTTGGPTSRET